MKTMILFGVTALLSACAGLLPAANTEAECRQILGTSFTTVAGDWDYNDFNCRIQRDHEDQPMPEPAPEMVFEPEPEEEQFPDEGCEGDDCGSDDN